ncbi:MAG: hypothetical protein Q4C20_11920 [Erysipelotrichaceae bacterium]|jgi:hypothetical protein|nr:hypothetical protein [Erysipelotrichaceae bacterium]
MMKNLFKSADRYMKESDWKDLAVIKLCLCSMGVLVGLSMPLRFRKQAAIAAGVIFTSAYGPLMEKYFRILSEDQKGDEED